jgi:DNA-binding NtrC family response regulator
VLAVRRATLRVVRGPDAGRELELGERTCAVIGTSAECDLVLADDSVSHTHAELRAEPDGFVLRDLDSTNGTRLGELRVREVVLAGKAQIAVGETVLELRLGRGEIEHELSGHGRFGDLIGTSPAMRRVFAQLERAAPTASTILLQGPSGTGKDLAAWSIHAASPRAGGPFVAVDCGAIPRGTIESELFGHVKGAFTGAVSDRDGLVAEAHGGTLFLDEIAELPLELQPKLLRVLEQHQVTPVGATRPRELDLRVIAASHHDLRGRVERGKFREDLYFRLAVVQIALPPLRERRADIPELARLFALELRPDLDVERVLGPELVAALARHDWPGNVRELRNVVERLLAIGELATPLRGQARAPAQPYAQARRDAIDRFEREYCRELMLAANRVAAEAARRAGLSRQMWHRLLKKHGVDTDEV